MINHGTLLTFRQCPRKVMTAPDKIGGMPKNQQLMLRPDWQTICTCGVCFLRESRRTFGLVGGCFCWRSAIRFVSCSLIRYRQNARYRESSIARHRSNEEMNEKIDSPTFGGQRFRYLATIGVAMTTLRAQPLGEGPKVMINSNAKGKDAL